MSTSTIVFLLSFFVALCFSEERILTPDEFLNEYHPNTKSFFERAHPQFVRPFQCYSLSDVDTCLSINYDTQISGRWWARNCCTSAQKPTVKLDTGLPTILVTDDCVQPNTELSLWWLDDNLNLTPELDHFTAC